MTSNAIRFALAVGVALIPTANVDARDLAEMLGVHLNSDSVGSLSLRHPAQGGIDCAAVREKAGNRRSHCITYAKIQTINKDLSYRKFNRLVRQCYREYAEGVFNALVSAGKNDGVCPVDATDSDDESFLLLITGASGRSDGAALTVEGIDPSVLYFSDIPYHDVGEVSINDLADNWDSYFEFAPNAALTWDRDQSSGRIVIELEAPTYDNGRLVFPYNVVSSEGQLAGVVSEIETQETVPENMQDIRLFVDSIWYTETCAIAITNLSSETLTLTEIHLDYGAETETPPSTLGTLDYGTFASEETDSEGACSGFIKYESDSGAEVSYYFYNSDIGDNEWAFHCDDEFGCYYNTVSDSTSLQQRLTICNPGNYCALDTDSPIDNASQTTMDAYENILEIYYNAAAAADG